MWRVLMSRQAVLVELLSALMTLVIECRGAL